MKNKTAYTVFSLLLLVVGGAILFSDVSVLARVTSFTLTIIGSFWLGRLTGK